MEKIIITLAHASIVVIYLSILSSVSISPLNDSPIRLSIITAHSQLNPAKAARGIIANVDTFPAEVPPFA